MSAGPHRSPPGASDPARGLARSVLYEGYVLWPYRRSAPKNQRRWTFGGVHPRVWSEGGHADDPWSMDLECLVELPGVGEPPTLEARLRFLQVVRRDILAEAPDGLGPVDRLEVDGETWLSWDEAREREIATPPLDLVPGAATEAPICIDRGAERRPLVDGDGRSRGAVERSWRTLEGRLHLACESAGPGVVRVHATATNTTPWRGGDREDVLRSTFASAHLVLELLPDRREPAGRVGDEATDDEPAVAARPRGGFVSLTDPPDGLAAAVAGCRNDGWWPILLGPRGSRATMLASAVILPDYPALAPESPGDLFDGGEIDELLALHVLALTDEEKAEMRATDPRTREILERTTALGRDRLRALHGAFRDPSTGDPLAEVGVPGDSPGGGGASGGDADGPPPTAPEDAGRRPPPDEPTAFWTEMARPGPAEASVGGVTLRRGSRVRLRPRPGGDVIDIALDGRIGIVEGIDEDDTGVLRIAVAVADDPGFDLGMDRLPGHRFFFRPAEIEPLETPRILVAGIGNIFFGDDAFGVEVVRRYARRAAPDGVTVRDYGIRGLDLAYDLGRFDTAVLVDAAPHGEAPGTVSVIDASAVDPGPAGPAGHGMDPVRVLALARELGPMPTRIRVLACEPGNVPDPRSDGLRGDLSPAVARAVEPAVERLVALVAELAADGNGSGAGAARPGAEATDEPVALNPSNREMES